MSTTLICAAPGADPGAMLEALAKEASDVSDALAGLNRRLGTSLSDRAARDDAPRELPSVLVEEVRSCLEAAPGTSLVAVDLADGTILPFLSALERPPHVLLVITAPMLAAERLAASTQRSIAFGLARYERSLRNTLANLVGLPVVVALESDPPSAVLGALGELEAGGAARPSREAPSEEGDGSRLLSELAELWQTTRSLLGTHERFSPPSLGTESSWTTELLALSDELEQLGAALVFSVDQLASVMEVEPPTSAAARRRVGSDSDEDQFQEPDEGEPYRLNASEDRHAYHQWLTWHREPSVIGGLDTPPLRRAATRAPIPRRAPLISIVVPVYRPPLWALERCVGSVLAQRFADWELCLCDDGSGDAELTACLRSLARLDRRIKVLTAAANGGISAATNQAIAASRGRFIAFLDHDDELAPQALASVVASLARDPEADLIYSDEDKIDVNGERFDPLFKPEWSPDLLLSFAYICHFTVVRRTLLDEVGGLRSEFDGSQDYDLTLRVSEQTSRIVHIPEVLYHWRSLPGSAAADSAGAQAKPWAYEAGRRAIADALERRGEPGEVTMLPDLPGRYHVRRTITRSPLVSIVIPFRDEPALLATCARTLRAVPGYDRIELVLVDNGSELPETVVLLEQLAEEPDVRIVDWPGAFNWAAINNGAARLASGDLLLFMNNDIEAQVPGWLDAMVGHALRPEVGAVGARLVYPDGSIQHAGVAIGLGGIAGHVLRGLPGDVPGYNSMAVQTRDCSVVTGAAMMVRRDVFLEVGGFDEELPVAFNDVDFCLKLRERGYLIVFTPLAELVHHESKSRGHTDDFAESRRILKRWGDVMIAGDPYMNVHLSHWRYWCPLSTAQEDDRWRNYLETRVLTPDSSSNE